MKDGHPDFDGSGATRCKLVPSLSAGSLDMSITLQVSLQGCNFQGAARCGVQLRCAQCTDTAAAVITVVPHHTVTNSPKRNTGQVVCDEGCVDAQRGVAKAQAQAVQQAPMPASLRRCGIRQMLLLRNWLVPGLDVCHDARGKVACEDLLKQVCA